MASVTKCLRESRNTLANVVKFCANILNPSWPRAAEFLKISTKTHESKVNFSSPLTVSVRARCTYKYSPIRESNSPLSRKRRNRLVEAEKLLSDARRVTTTNETHSGIGSSVHGWFARPHQREGGQRRKREKAKKGKRKKEKKRERKRRKNCHSSRLRLSFASLAIMRRPHTRLRSCNFFV